MTTNATLYLSEGQKLTLDKAHVTVGHGSEFDCHLGSVKVGLLFALQKTSGDVHLMPGKQKLFLNGKKVSRPTKISLCDRIEWQGGSAVFIDVPTKRESAQTVSRIDALGALENVLSELEETDSVEPAMEQLLIAIMEATEAEEAYLLTEGISGNSGEWTVLASFGAPKNNQRQRELVSHTVLNQAIQEQAPVYIESLVGHPLEKQASLMGVATFSVACLPLKISGRVFGVVYLCSRTPGRSIRSEALRELSVLATQAGLLTISQAALKRVQTKREIAPANTLIFQAAPMTEMFARLQKLAPTALNILIGGETGTGKELIAREIHRLSPRASGPFIVVNCGAIPPTLIESVLFGHAKGAFTGATNAQPGKFLLADKGTIFLDEIAELPLDMQQRLLRVLQEKEVEAIGSNETKKVDFRVVAATHRNLEELISQNKFRQDLFFRLNGASLAIPPLKQRGAAEIILLAKHFCKGSGKSFSKEALEKLASYGWPGNVRELEQVVTRACALSLGQEIGPSDIEIETQKDFSDKALPPLRQRRSAYTRSVIHAAIEKYNGNRAKAAHHLGISERTLYRMLAAETAPAI